MHGERRVRFVEIRRAARAGGRREESRAEPVGRLSSSTSPRAGAPADEPSSFGQVADVAFEPDGRHAWVFHRGSRIWTADSFDGGALRRVTRDAPIPENTVARVCLTSGKITRTFGAGEHYMPHGLTLGPDGDVWIVDAGLHQVIRYDAETGERVAAYGAKLEPGRGADGFCMPTDVAVAEDNSFWVADGYCASRIARFDASGAYVGEWSEERRTRRRRTRRRTRRRRTPRRRRTRRRTPSRWTAVARDSSSRIANARGSSCIARTEASSARTTSPRTVKCTASRCYVRRIRACTVSTRCVGAGDPTVVRAPFVSSRAGSRAERTASAPPRTGTSRSHRAAHARRRERWGGGNRGVWTRNLTPRRRDETERRRREPSKGVVGRRRRRTRDRERTHRGDDDTRHLVVAPARGWTPDSEPAVDVPALGSRRETAEAAKATKIAERASEPSIASAGDADTDARSYDDDDDDADEDQVRLPAPQHGGGGGGILPGGGLVVERGSMEGVASGTIAPRAAASHGRGGGGDGGGVRDRERTRRRRAEGDGDRAVETGRRPETRGRGGAGGGVRAARRRRERLRCSRDRPNQVGRGLMNPHDYLYERFKQ